MKKRSGFTLIELMIVITIIGVLASVALATYASFTSRSAYTEVILAAQGYKRAVDVCVLSSPLTDCNTGTNGVPDSNPTQAVASIAVSSGEITVTPKAFKGITSTDVYVLTPNGGGSGQNITLWTDNCDTNEFC